MDGALNVQNAINQIPWVAGLSFESLGRRRSLMIFLLLLLLFHHVSCSSSSCLWTVHHAPPLQSLWSGCEWITHVCHAAAENDLSTQPRFQTSRTRNMKNMLKAFPVFRDIQPYPSVIGQGGGGEIFASSYSSATALACGHCAPKDGFPSRSLLYSWHRQQAAISLTLAGWDLGEENQRRARSAQSDSRSMRSIKAKQTTRTD